MEQSEWKRDKHEDTASRRSSASPTWSFLESLDKATLEQKVMELYSKLSRLEAEKCQLEERLRSNPEKNEISSSHQSCSASDSLASLDPVNSTAGISIVVSSPDDIHAIQNPRDLEQNVDHNPEDRTRKISDVFFGDISVSHGGQLENWLTHSRLAQKRHSECFHFEQRPPKHEVSPGKTVAKRLSEGVLNLTGVLQNRSVGRSTADEKKVRDMDHYEIKTLPISSCQQSCPASDSLDSLDPVNSTAGISITVSSSDDIHAMPNLHDPKENMDYNPEDRTRKISDVFFGDISMSHGGQLENWMTHSHLSQKRHSECFHLEPRPSVVGNELSPGKTVVKRLSEGILDLTGMFQNRSSRRPKVDEKKLLDTDQCEINADMLEPCIANTEASVPEILHHRPSQQLVETDMPIPKRTKSKRSKFRVKRSKKKKVPTATLR